MQLSDGSARLLAGLLETRTGQQLGGERRWRIELALRPILQRHGLSSADLLVAHLAGGGNRALVAEVIDALLNNETSFFRDRAAFALLQDKGLARLERARGASRRLSVWCAGCSTGQEAYTVAMIFADQAERWRGWTVDIVATDVSAAAIAAARAGRYSHFEIQRGLTAAGMVRWFGQVGEHWVAQPGLGRRVRFLERSLLDDPPAPGRFDLVLCRNLLFYFSPAVRRVAFGRLAAAIAPDGMLMLGAGETVLGHSDEFVSDYEARGLYRPALDRGAERAA